MKLKLDAATVLSAGRDPGVTALARIASCFYS